MSSVTEIRAAHCTNLESEHGAEGGVGLIITPAQIEQL